MGTTWSSRKPPPPAVPGLLDRGAERWAAMRANPVKGDPTLGPVAVPSQAYNAVTQPDGSAVASAPKAKPKASSKKRYF